MAHPRHTFGPPASVPLLVVARRHTTHPYLLLPFVTDLVLEEVELLEAVQTHLHRHYSGFALLQKGILNIYHRLA
jgi:hypothetical protein